MKDLMKLTSDLEANANINFPFKIQHALFLFLCFGISFASGFIRIPFLFFPCIAVYILCYYIFFKCTIGDNITFKDFAFKIIQPFCIASIAGTFMYGPKDIWIYIFIIFSVIIFFVLSCLIINDIYLSNLLIILENILSMKPKFKTGEKVFLGSMENTMEKYISDDEYKELLHKWKMQTPFTVISVSVNTCKDTDEKIIGYGLQSDDKKIYEFIPETFLEKENLGR